jgi:hypothetical protein
VDNNLNTLIAYYEEEKVRLLQLIDNYAKEEEYQLAHFHQEALYQLNRRLQTLKNIDDKHYDEKYFKQNIIKSLEERLNSESSEYMREFLTQELSKKKEELTRLNEHPVQPNDSGDKLILDEVLSKLLERKVRSFKLILKKSDNLFLQFNYYNKALKVSLPFVKLHKKKMTLHNGAISSFNHLGFSFTVNENKLVLRLKGDKDEILNKLKIILSKIVFEIFYFKEFTNESYIEINEKASR